MDYRYFCHHKRSWYEKLNQRQTKVLINPENYFEYLENTCDEEECEEKTNLISSLIKEDDYIHLPITLTLCPSCEGKGAYVDPNIDSHGICQDEFDQEWSFEDKENYFSGFYNITCAECNGQKVVPKIDTNYLKKTEIFFAKLINKKINEEYQEGIQYQKEMEMGY